MTPDPTNDPHTFAGNWKTFATFVWHDQPDDAENFGIYCIGQRNSDLMEQSNASVVRDALLPYAGDVIEQRFSHWLCGWVDALAIRVFDAAGRTTPAFDTLVALLERPVPLDEGDLTRREYEATLDNLREVGRIMLDRPAPEGWEAKAYRWLWDNLPREIECRDGGGGYPSDEAMTQCLTALGWLDPE